MHIKGVILDFSIVRLCCLFWLGFDLGDRSDQLNGNGVSIFIIVLMDWSLGYGVPLQLLCLDPMLLQLYFREGLM